MKHRKAHVIDYPAYRSKLYKYNAPFKIIIAVLTLILCVASDNIYAPLFVAVSMAALSVKGGVKPSEYLFLMLVPIGFIALGTAAIALGVSAEPAAHSVKIFRAYFYISATGLKSAALAAARAFGAVSALYTLALSTPVDEIVSAMKKIHMPNLIISLMYMIYRFIFILFDVYRKMKTAATSRLGYCGFRTSCRSFALSAASLLIISMKKANACYDAMASRGFDGEALFWEEDKPLKPSHLLAGAVYIACVAVILIIF